MLTKKFSRRRLLGSILAALSGCLLPRPPRTIAATPRPTPHLHHNRGVTTYIYDSCGRLLTVTDHPLSAAADGALPAQAWESLRLGECTVYDYDGRVLRASEKTNG